MNFLPLHAEKSVLRLFEDIGTLVALKASLLYRHGEWDQLASMRVDPKMYSDPDSYWRDATTVSIIRKLEDLPTTINRKVVAEESFLACEKECFRTNVRLLPYLSPGLPDTEVGVVSFIRRARKICRMILGRPPELNTLGRHGPGSTFSDRGSLSTIPDKMSSVPTFTPDSWPFLFEWAGTAWASACANSGRSPQRVEGNRFTTVPKDCTKNRGIAIEPSINIFFQLGAGGVIRRRLRRFGIDLEHGQDIHRRVACEASIKRHLATIDLSSASDTVSSNLVKLLLPPDWFEYLDDLRSKKTLFRGKWHVLEKFSSMGNGFTFELETLVFLTLILALDPALKAGENVYVYGDDIIVPVSSTKDVIAMLSFFGMTTNKSKTYVEGPFRESCGGDYFDGVDVRPLYLKKSPNEPQQMIAFANGLRSLMIYPSRRHVVMRAWKTVLDGIPSHIRSLRGPSDLGDLVIHDDEAYWAPKVRHSIRYFRCYRPARYRKVPWKVFDPDVILATALLMVPNTPGGIIPRDAVLGYKIGWVACS
jgi:hypothetical protein